MSYSQDHRFLLFDGENHYPEGGCHDFVCSHPTLEDCIKTAKKRCRSDNQGKENWAYRWAHVWDREQGKIVWDNHWPE